MPPRHVRNFWITTSVDGNHPGQGTGPRAADGGFVTTIAMRQNGAVDPDILILTGLVEGDKVVLRLTHYDGRIICELENNR